MPNNFESLKITNPTAESYTLEEFYLDQIQERKYLILDIEATGLDYNNEEITEIAVLPIENLKPDYSELISTLIKTTKPIPENVQKITGITNEDVENGQPLQTVLADLVDKYRDYVWVAQCGFEFDFPFLNKEYRRFFDEALPVGVLDTKLLYASLYPETNATISTNFLMKQFGIDPLEHPRHRAAGDVLRLTKIFLNIIEKYTQKDIDTVEVKQPLQILKFVIS